jgi:histidine triad (HIT) family protein
MMKKDCLFCKIINREIESDIQYEDDEVIAFRDINPQAPTHILIVPKEHIEKISDIKESNKGIVSKLILTANKIAKDLQVKDSGYRLVFNCGANAGQEVFHIHLHLLGGRVFKWPPG